MSATEIQLLIGAFTALLSVVGSYSAVRVHLRYMQRDIDRNTKRGERHADRLTQLEINQRQIAA